MMIAEALAAIEMHFARTTESFVRTDEPTEEDIRRIKAALVDAMATSPEPVIAVTYDPETRTVNVVLPGNVDTIPVTVDFAETP
jgi:hypothetical protein